MRYTVRFIPLHQIKTEASTKMTGRSRELRSIAQDCMQMLVVRKSKKEGGFVVVSGHNHLDFWRKHSKKQAAPCLVDESKLSSQFSSWMYSLSKPYRRERSRETGWSIIRAFMKKDPRFKQLTRIQQAKVLRMGLQYKRTTMQSMRAKVDSLLSKKK